MGDADMTILRMKTVYAPLPRLSGDLTVHSVFRSGLNLVSIGGAMMWISYNTGAGYPSSLEVDISDREWVNLDLDRQLHQGDSVPIHNGLATRLQLTPSISLVIDAETTEESAILPSGYTAHHSHYAESITHAIAEIERDNPPQYASITTTINHHLSTAIRSAWRQDAPACLDHLCRIIGLGYGLTPSGDDSVIGALAYTRIFSPRTHLQLSHAVSQLLDRTTMVSATYLRHGTRGYFSHLLANTLRGFYDTPSPDALRQLLQTGHSSGEDTARGILTAHRTINSQPFNQSTKEYSCQLNRA